MSADSAEDRLSVLRARLREFVAERDWQQFHDPKNLAMALASEAGELLAELRWVANDQADSFIENGAARERIEREVGDVTIGLLLFCERTNIDLLTAAERKLQLNAENYPVELSKGRSTRPSPRP